MKHSPALFLFLTTLLSLTACESNADKSARLERERQARIEREQQEMVEQEDRRRKQEIFLEFSENSLERGATPWATCFGHSNSCNGSGCSEIIVNGPSVLDVVVLLKQNGVTKRHAFIPAGNSYTFNIPNGTWQPFFYYGKGWYPEKEMNSPSCASLQGGFLENEDWDKDLPDSIEDMVVTYTLTSVVNGNFRTLNSSQSEAL